MTEHARESATNPNARKDAVATVLVVDDEETICWAFQKLLEGEGHRVAIAPDAETGLRLATQERPDLVLLDVRLPGEDGVSALPKFIEATGGSPVIIMTAFGDLRTAVAAVERGASEYLVKPFNLDEARRVCRVALSTSRNSSAPTAVHRRSEQPNELIGASAPMQQVFRQIALVAPSELSVLITGETGTGKELVGTAIHDHSPRADRPYLPIAPVALNDDLIESELFGHAKGAFTGADRDRPGIFEQAEGGTVLLDEIGDLPMSLQVKLLRVLEQGEYFRVGENLPRRCNVRILAATNRDLSEAMRQDEFREDLFYRLSGLHIHLPPLRQRTDDVAILCRYFLKRLGNDLAAETLDGDVVGELSRRPWYGNVRELQNSIEHAAVVARGRSLTIDDFPPAQDLGALKQASSDLQVAESAARWAVDKLNNGSSGTLYSDFVATFEPSLIKAVLQHTGDNRAAAAEILGIHRSTLREKMRQFEETGKT